ncbi:MAG: DUF1684 domain-containing protein [Luteitalea sp.]|nr:DUF1684 domain-containing protein [Luteitalea sp.]
MQKGDRPLFGRVSSRKRGLSPFCIYPIGVVTRLASVSILALTVVSCTNAPPPPDAANYPEGIQALRVEKDDWFRTGDDSPVPPTRREALVPLAYFPVDERYRVPAALTPSSAEPVMVMATSTGQQRPMRRAGRLEFTLLGRELAVTAFVEAEDTAARRLFVPFRDPSNGTETYAGGRYLDLDRTATGLYEVDFNRAYHPYCYYNETYDCPFPPPENRLSVRVQAGERVKK